MLTGCYMVRARDVKLKWVGCTSSLLKVSQRCKEGKVILKAAHIAESEGV